MSDIVIVSPDGVVPDSLALLSHTITPAMGIADTLALIEDTDVVVIDGSADLAWGRGIAQGLRSASDDVAVLLLVSVTGLALLSAEWGFNDFVAVGCEPAELDTRIRLLLRAAQESGVLTAGPVRIDEAAYHATIEGEPLDLTYTEFELLRYLMQHPGRVLTREVLLSQVWGYDYYGGTRTVDVHVRRLRAKLGQFDHFIKTVRNVGYRFASSRDLAHD
ncbi:MAG: winged-helix domain-containing protein [Arachnia sp.]